MSWDVTAEMAIASPEAEVACAVAVLRPTAGLRAVAALVDAERLT
jgi:hypothetical protein